MNQKHEWAGPTPGTLAEFICNLQTIIEQHPGTGEWPVVLASDSEGNQFSLLDGREGISLQRWHSDHLERGQIIDGQPDAVVLWPSA